MRPKQCRRVEGLPDSLCFRPEGSDADSLEKITLSLDECEAVRLADLRGLYQEAAALKMGVSRQTFGRIIESAHRKIADALIHAKALVIEGGSIEQDERRSSTMKIAVPARDEMIDGHFGHCEHFRIFTVDEGRKIISEERLTPPPGCGCKSTVVPDLVKMGVSLMIAGNMGEGAVHKLNANGIDVIRGCSGEPKAAIEAYLAGSLSDSGTGCASHEHGHECSHQ